MWWSALLESQHQGCGDRRVSRSSATEFRARVGCESFHSRDNSPSQHFGLAGIILTAIIECVWYTSLSLPSSGLWSSY